MCWSSWTSSLALAAVLLAGGDPIRAADSQPVALAHATPETLLTEIEEDGAAATIRTLNHGNANEWRHMLAQVETGSQSWLDVAIKLLAASDAGRTTDLYFALSIALTRNATGVLS